MLSEYENWLVVISIIVAVLASCATLRLTAKAAARSASKVRYWITGGAISIATAIWALHFIGMLALDLPIALSYNIPIPLLSLFIAMFVCGYALYTHAAELEHANRMLRAETEERKRVEQALRESEARYRELVELSPDAILVELAGKIVFANGASKKLLRADSSYDLLGKAILDLTHIDSREIVAERMRELFECNQAIRPLAQKLIRADGTAVDVEIAAAPHAAEGKRGAQVVIRDITERKKAEERLSFLAQFDSLTGLPNRNLFTDRLSHALVRARRKEQSLALMMLDLDNFKEINDSLGHAAGDKVLRLVAETLRNTLREVDTIARFAGDEFTIVLEDIAKVEEAVAVAEKIRHALETPFLIDEREIFVTASMGVSIYPHGGLDMERLLQTADVALYRAKEEGRNGYELYTAEMNRDATKQLDMETLLRRALERHEFVLHYQPKVHLKTGRISGVEALLRWESPELGLVAPADFIPLAEKTGLIVPVGEWALGRACAENKAWQDAGYSPLVMAVNLSPRQFRQQNLAATVADVLQETRLAPKWLELELTETMMMVHADKAVAILEALHALGVQLSIDDFGTGYSSLGYLKRFPVQKLKIDRSFVRDICRPSDDNLVITEAVIALAKSLGLGVVAEGVETKEQFSVLAQLNCDEYQGYYFSKPLPASDFARLLERHSASRNVELEVVHAA